MQWPNKKIIKIKLLTWALYWRKTLTEYIHFEFSIQFLRVLFKWRATVPPRDLNKTFFISGRLETSRTKKSHLEMALSHISPAVFFPNGDILHFLILFLVCFHHENVFQFISGEFLTWTVIESCKACEENLELHSHPLDRFNFSTFRFKSSFLLESSVSSQSLDIVASLFKLQVSAFELKIGIKLRMVFDICILDRVFTFSFTSQKSITMITVL